MEKVIGSMTSVHNGCFANDYQLANSKDIETASKYSSTGATATMLANRINWFFDLKDPNLNLNSACSSSMMTFDITCQCLRNGDSIMVCLVDHSFAHMIAKQPCKGIVSGCNLFFLPDSTAVLSKMSFLSHDSKCFSFDHRANGYARGEGFGVIIIKLLSEAVKDEDMIRAVIRSTGSNQDGRTPGITQPSQDFQQRLIEKTYEKAGLSLGRTRFVEAHGTGTSIGDSTEAVAIGSAFRDHRNSNEPLIM